MKKGIYWAFFLISSALIWVGCSNSGSTPEKKANQLASWREADGRIKVLSTTAMIGDLVSQIGKDRISQIVLITGDMDPHSYEIVKGDDEKIARADVVFANGLLLEHSASMQHKLRTHKNSIFLGDLILERSPNQFIYVDGQVDPHIWMDISIWTEIVDPIADTFAKIDPENAELYRERATELKNELLQEDERIFTLLQSIPESRRYLVTSHDAFNYFGRRYLASSEERKIGEWEKRVKALQGLAPEEQISSIEIQSVVNHTVTYDIGVIFYESNLSRDSLSKVVDACTRMGRPIHLAEDALYGDTLGEKSYIGMLQTNANTIYDSLMKEEKVNAGR